MLHLAIAYHLTATSVLSTLILDCAFCYSVSNRWSSMDAISTPIHTALTGQIPSSRSAGVGINRCDNSLGVYHCGGGPGKSNSHLSSQQRIPDECGRGRVIHIWPQTICQFYFSTLSSPVHSPLQYTLLSSGIARILNIPGHNMGTTNFVRVSTWSAEVLVPRGV